MIAVSVVGLGAIGAGPIGYVLHAVTTVAYTALATVVGELEVDLEEAARYAIVFSDMLI